MDDSLLGLLGLCKKAGKLEVGDEAVTAAAKAHKARLILIAADGAESTRRRAQALATDNCPALVTPLTRAQLGGAAGRATCAVAAVTDVGLAAAAVKKLAGADPDAYGGAAARLTYKAEKTQRRRRAQKEAEKEREARQRKPWAQKK